MRFISRWQFSLGTQLAVACVSADGRFPDQRVTLEGIVVWCEPVARGPHRTFETTILFLELPEELRQSLREFSFQVEE